MSLATRYRPQTFEDLVGQLSAAQSLKNALDFRKIGHAYLFHGARGVGKTTMARILAKALNCANGPTSQICNVCEHCVEIAEGRSTDVIEIDAASNRGIDNIRELRAQAVFAPMKSRYKVYIIDEVHMLSKNAFNALLKTLEEPPPHVKFIFATTEIRKVPVTVLSRCQRFDLRRIESGELAAYLGQIAAKEKVEIEEGALALIARAAALQSLTRFDGTKVEMDFAGEAMPRFARAARQPGEAEYFVAWVREGSEWRVLERSESLKNDAWPPATVPDGPASIRDVALPGGGAGRAPPGRGDRGGGVVHGVHVSSSTSGTCSPTPAAAAKPRRRRAARTASAPGCRRTSDGAAGRGSHARRAAGRTPRR